MKWLKLFSLILAVTLLSLSSCANKLKDASLKSSDLSATSSLSHQDKDKSDGYNYLDNLNIMYQQGKNFEIYTDKEQTGFHYYVKNNDGNIIDEGYHNWRGSFGFNAKNSILELDYGFGGPLWQRRYYDVSSSRVSRFFPKPLQTSEELIAYFSTSSKSKVIVLVVQNMFDISKFYKEIKRNFSSAVIRNQSPAEFINGNKQLKVTYWVNPKDEEVTEIIDLN